MKEYILRKISKRKGDKYSYVYFDKNGKRANKYTIEKALEGLYLPPAHDNVKISLNKKDKVLAIGYDVKGRAHNIHIIKSLLRKHQKLNINT